MSLHMFRNKRLLDWVRLLALGTLLTMAGVAEAQQKPQGTRQKPAPSAKPAASDTTADIEPKALDILKAASDRLAAARLMAFTAVVTYESPSLLGPALAYTTKSEVTLQRPDKLRVITSGDGPPTEFYCDGKKMTALAPAENLVAIADAPPTVDAALKEAYDSAAIYFPFSDLIVADPYKDIADGLKFAFYIGQSKVVGGTTTDMVAYASEGVFVQIWIGAEDKLPRMARAVYRDDPSQLRHQLEVSDWKLDVPAPPDTFAARTAANATHIKFARPDPHMPPGAKLPARAKPPKN